MIASDRARQWLADHLAAIVIVLLALWAPPIIFAVLVNLKIVDGVGAGYPTLRDPALLLGILQIALMTAAVPLLSYRQARGWQLIAGACVMWLAHAAWTIQGRLRLIGISDLKSRETLVTSVALAIGVIVVVLVKDRYDRSGALTSLRSTDPRRAAPQPDRT